VYKDRKACEYVLRIIMDDEGAHPKRARYHLGMLDGNVLDPGEFFDKLPETYVIFVTQNDTLGYGLPIAHIDRTIKANIETVGGWLAGRTPAKK